MKIEKIGLYGIGMVGSQVKNWFIQNGFKVCSYDKDKNIGTFDRPLEADIIFICVPTPYKEGGEYDLSILDEVIAQIPDGKTIVIKSTVNPGTTDAYQMKYPKKIFLFNPEFLTEAVAKEEFFNPDMQIIGTSTQYYWLAEELLKILPQAPIMRVIPTIDAEWVKKVRNAYYATKVIFFNQIFDIIKASNADYETIREIVVKDKSIGDSHSLIFHKGARGFGGKCLPKDTYSLIDYAKNKGVDCELLEVVRKINKNLKGDISK